MAHRFPDPQDRPQRHSRVHRRLPRALPHTLTQALTGSHPLAGGLLSCPEQAGYGRGATGILGLLDGASERRAEVITLALVLAAYEDATGKHSWRHLDPATARYLHFLTGAGYTPSPVEQLGSGQQPPAADAE